MISFCDLLAREAKSIEYELYSCRGDELTQEGQQLLNFQGWRGQLTPEIKKEVINALLLLTDTAQDDLELNNFKLSNIKTSSL